MNDEPKCESGDHFFKVKEPVTDTPPEQRCACGACTWGEMDAKLLETIWNLKG